VIGNVGEWTASCWDSPPGSPPANLSACGSRTVRGGSWDTAAAGVSLAAGEPASSAGEGRGFRLLREL
jgi:formylglycine-generating enzyme required for sulfatase activity